MDVQRLHNYLLKGSETVKSAAHIRNIYSSPWDDKMHNKSVGVSITTQLFVLHSLVSKQVFADQSVYYNMIFLCGTLFATDFTQEQPAPLAKWRIHIFS